MELNKARAYVHVSLFDEGRIEVDWNGESGDMKELTRGFAKWLEEDNG